MDEEKCFLDSMPKVSLAMLESIGGIKNVYNQSIPEIKQKILKGVFPKSYELDVENRRVRTTYINSLFKVNNSKSIDYIGEETKKGTIISESPFLGGRRDSNPRPSVPQTDALTS